MSKTTHLGGGWKEKFDLKAFIHGLNIAISLMLVVVAAGLVFVAIPTFGNKALIVRSASMQPTIPVGGLVVVQQEQAFLSPLAESIIPKYRESDVIAFQNPANQKIITTHRIVAQELKDGKIFYQTKGDANNSPDNGLVIEENILGKSRFSVPFIGKLISFTKSNIGFPLLVIFPAVLVIIFESFAILKELRKGKIPETPGSRLPSLAFKIIVIAFLIVVSVSQNSFAFFQDTEQSTGNTFTAAEDFDED